MDIETFHPTLSVVDVGSDVYSRESEIILFCGAMDDGEPWVWEEGDDPAKPKKFLAKARRIVAHNCFFERNNLGRRGWSRRPIEDWGCTMAQAYAHGLPGGLDMLCRTLGLDEDKAKVADGKRLIRTFCKPQRGGLRLRKEDTPEDWAKFRSYVKQDVVAMRESYHKMPRVNLDAAGIRA